VVKYNVVLTLIYFVFIIKKITIMKKKLLPLNSLLKSKNYYLFVTAFLLLLSFFNLQKSFAQVAGNYNFTNTYSSLTYTPLTGQTVAFTGSAIHYNSPSAAVANAPVAVTIPFSFNYNGTGYTSCNISKNGFITFGVTPPTSTGNNPPISGITAYAGAISGFSFSGGGLVYAEYNATYGAGLYPSEVSYKTTGTTPNQVFTVQYKNLIRKGAVGAGSSIGLLNFQIKLYESTNVIETWYDTLNPTSPGTTASSTTAQQIGLRGATNADYSNVRLNWGSGAVNGYTGAVLTPATANNDSANLGNAAGTYPAAVTRYTWSPCYPVQSLAATAVSNSVVTWAAPAVTFPFLSYNYEIRTSGAYGSGAVGLFPGGSGTVSATTFTASGLTVGVTYTIYVATSCGRVMSIPVTPACSIATIPYTQNFETATVPAVPPCNYVVTNSGGQPFITTNLATPNSNSGGFSSKFVSSLIGPDSWYFTQKINFPTAGSYKLSYYYGGDRSQSFFEQKMKVAFGPNATATAGVMTGGIVIETHPSIKTSPNLNVVNFVVATAGDYYIGFQNYTSTNNGQLIIDNILLEASTCLTPTAITAPVSQITGSTALITWTDPASVPDGYIIYYSTSPTAPLNINTVGNGGYIWGATSTTITGLTGSTNYYVWVRSFCDGGDEFGAWVPITQPVTGPYFTTLFVPTYCIPVTATNQNYFTNVTSSNGVININNTTGYATGGYGNYTAQIVSQSIGNTVNLTTAYNSMSGGVGVAVWVDWNQDGTFTDSLYNSVTNPGGEKMYNSASFLSVPPAISFAVPSVIALPGPTTGLPPLGITRMRLVVDWNATSPTPCSTTINRGEAEDYSFKVAAIPPPLTLSSYSSTQCAGINSPLVTITSTLSNFDTYSWSPSTGVTGTKTTGYIFNNTTTTPVIYTLTATQITAPYSVNTVKFTYYGMPYPAALTIAPAVSVLRCQTDTPTLLTANGGTINDVVVYQENFNSGDGGWTQVNNSFGGPVAVTTWTIQNSPFTEPYGSITSNDSSSFFVSNSDAQGSGNTTDVILTSPSTVGTINLSGYSSANLSYYQFYQPFNSSAFAKVQISINGGGAWTDLQTWTTTGSGTSSNFININISLTPYVGNANVMIRFNYHDVWGFFWAVDNIKITGSSTNNTIWSPATGLYTGVDASNNPINPYDGITPRNTIYASPNSSQLYTATASTTGVVCSVSTTVQVNVTPIAKGTVSSAQSVCSGLPAPLTISGQNGTIAEWQWSLVSPFTVPSTNSIAATAGLSTLPTASMPSLTADTYFRVKITNGICTTYSDPILITLSNTTWSSISSGSWSNGTPTSTKAVIFTYPFNSTGPISACSVVITGGVTVTMNHVLTVENGLNTTGGTLIFTNGASLIQNNTLANTTPIEYHRNSTTMVVYDYTFWSSPVANQNLYTFSPNTLADKYFYWNTTPSVYNWTVIMGGATTMTPTKGYIVRSPILFGYAPAIFDGKFVGIPNNGNYSYPIEVSGVAGANNMNLIGNPYPSGLSANAFIMANSTVINGTLYFWSHNTPANPGGATYTNNDYAAYNMSGGVATYPAPNTAGTGLGNNSTPSGIIGAGQAFVVEGLPAVMAAPGGILPANFTNAMRVTSNSQFYRNAHTVSNNTTTTELEKHRIWLEMTNNQGAYSQMLYGNIEGATNAKDQLFDGLLFDNSPSVSLYSILGSDYLTIKGNALPFAVTDTDQLGYIANVAGTFEIGLADVDGLFATQDIYLEDTSLGIIHNLKTSKYSFGTQVGTFNNRFILRFTNASLATNTAISNDNKIVVYKKLDEIHINTFNIDMKSVSIIDVSGRIIYKNDAVGNPNQLVVRNLNASNQVLMVQVTTKDGTITNKKIVF
jgi:hypothetical protein